MEANLLHGVRNVRACDRQVLQGACNASVGGDVVDGEPSVAEAFDFVSASVATGLQLAMPACSRISSA